MSKYSLDRLNSILETAKERLTDYLTWKTKKWLKKKNWALVACGILSKYLQLYKYL